MAKKTLIGECDNVTFTETGSQRCRQPVIVTGVDPAGHRDICGDCDMKHHDFSRRLTEASARTIASDPEGCEHWITLTEQLITEQWTRYYQEAARKPSKERDQLMLNIRRDAELRETLMAAVLAISEES